MKDVGRGVPPGSGVALAVFPMIPHADLPDGDPALILENGDQVMDLDIGRPQGDCLIEGLQRFTTGETLKRNYSVGPEGPRTFLSWIGPDQKWRVLGFNVVKPVGRSTAEQGQGFHSDIGDNRHNGKDDHDTAAADQCGGDAVFDLLVEKSCHDEPNAPEPEPRGACPARRPAVSCWLLAVSFGRGWPCSGSG